MPIGFSDLLQTNAQYVNGLNKGIVNTDDSYGGTRSPISNWTNLHLDTKTNDNGVTYRTFQDNGTAAAPGQFKAYSTMFYVADGRALVEDPSASSNFIELDSSGNFVSSGGTRYVVPATGNPEPEFWVLDDATQIGGTGPGTDKLPTFTITGTQGDGSTAIPAGYQKLQVLTNAASPPTGDLGYLEYDDISVTTDDASGGGTLSYNETNGEFTFQPADVSAFLTSADISSFIDLTDISVGTDGPASGSGSLAYASTTGVFTYTPPDLSSYLTSSDISTFIALSDISVGPDETADGSGGLAYDDTSGVFTYTPPDLTSYLTSTDISSFITGIGVLEGTDSTSYKLVMTAAVANNEYETVYIDSNDLSFTPGNGSNAGVLSVGGLSVGGNATIGGNLTVVGEVFQTNSTEVNFNDTILRTNVPTAGTANNIAGPTVGVTGIEAFNGVTANAYVAGAKLVYDYAVDKWKASTQAAASTYDNVATLKFDVTDSNTQVSQANGTATMNAADETNASSVRSLGAVSKCSIDITSSATDGSSNYAPAEAAANGYPIKHNLGTESVYVFAIKTHDEGTALGDPIPIFCKWVPEDANTVRVTVGITAEDDKYDIIVVG